MIIEIWYKPLHQHPISYLLDIATFCLFLWMHINFCLCTHTIFLCTILTTFLQNTFIIVNGCVLNLSTSPKNANELRLLDMISTKETDSFKPDSASQIRSFFSFHTPLSADETEMFIKELYLSLCEMEALNASTPVTSDASDTTLSVTLSLAEKFLSALKYLLKLLDYKMPIEALFVTPADLVYHSDNLTQVGTLDLTRIY